MFIEKLTPVDLGEPIYGRKRLIALLKELGHLNWGCFSINISPLRGFPRQTPKRAAEFARKFRLVMRRGCCRPFHGLTIQPYVIPGSHAACFMPSSASQVLRPMTSGQMLPSVHSRLARLPTFVYPAMSKQFTEKSTVT